MTQHSPIGLRAVLHALDAHMVHLSLTNPTNQLLFYVSSLVVPNDSGVLPGDVWRTVIDERDFTPRVWRWLDLRSLRPGEVINSGPINLAPVLSGALRYATVQPIEGKHKADHPVLSNVIHLG